MTRVTRPRVMTGLSVVILACALAGCGGSDTKERTPADPETSSETPQAEPNVGDKALQVGQTREGTGLTVQLAEVKVPYPPGEYRTPEAGKKFVGLRIKQCMREDYAPENMDETYSTSQDDWYAASPNGGSGHGWVVLGRLACPEVPRVRHDEPGRLPAGMGRPGGF